MCVTHLLDEVSGIDGQVGGQVEFTLQDLIDGLLPVFSSERRLVENHRKELLKLLVSLICYYGSKSITATIKSITNKKSYYC